MKAQQRDDLIKKLKTRFEQHRHRHPDLDWDKVQVKLESNPKKLHALEAMEATGGEPDVVGYDKKASAFIFYDCAAESPSGRRSVCYDQQALDARKEHKPKDSAVGMAAAMGVEIMSEEEYHALQKLGSFDLKTSSWIKTPEDIRSLGGAIFGDLRYGRVFIYHNGAQSYYAARGFRAVLRV